MNAFSFLLEEHSGGNPLSNVPFYQPPFFKLMAIDPGTMKMGVSIFDLDLACTRIKSIRSWTVYPDRLPNTTGLVELIHPESLVRLLKAKNEIYRIMKEEGIHYLAYEAPFLNHLMPTAYGPLVKLMSMVQLAALEYAQDLPFVIFPPLTVKKTIGVAGKKGKDVVIEAISKIEVLRDALQEGQCELGDLDDNAVDSIAVGYTAFRNEIFQG